MDWQDPGYHHHPSLEISILMEGKGVFQWKDKIEMLEAGNVVIVPAFLEHRFEGIGKNRYGVTHLENIPGKLAEMLKGLVRDEKPTVFALSPLDKERYERLFREWLRIMSSPLKEKVWTDTAWSEVLVLFLLEHSQADRAALSIAKAGDWIRENLQHGVQISELAELAGMTESGFRRLFEQIYKLSPKQYQQQCRMAEAKWQLSSSEKDMLEIADLIGFSRQHSFSLWFKKLEGVAPSEWRRLQRMNFG
jgi:AraC-like DNA-binding protein